ncbi:MAG: hypothetical protein V4726_15940 [Verrucomicrobiota bacterium]
MSLPVIEYSEKLIAFIDVIGFREMINNLEAGSPRASEIHEALERIKNVERASQIPDSVANDCTVSVFSDSIVITTKLDRVAELLWICGLLHSDLLALGVSLRGGITCGKIYHSDGIAYGAGLIAAIDLEAGSAVFPRIVLSDEVRKLAGDKHRDEISRDSGGVWYMRPLVFIPRVKGADGETASTKDGAEFFFAQVSRHIKQNIRTAKKPNHVAKWIWLANCFNHAAIGSDRLWGTLIPQIDLEEGGVRGRAAKSPPPFDL